MDVFSPQNETNSNTSDTCSDRCGLTTQHFPPVNNSFPKMHGCFQHSKLIFLSTQHLSAGNRAFILNSLKYNT